MRYCTSFRKINVLLFSFQTLTPEDEEKKLTVTKTQTLENIPNSRIDVGEHVPLIPKPPSYQVAILERSSAEVKSNDQQQLDRLQNNIIGTEIQPKTLVEIHSNIHPSGQLNNITRVNSSTPNSFPKSSESDSMNASNYLYGDTTSLYGNQKEITSSNSVVL